MYLSQTFSDPSVMLFREIDCLNIIYFLVVEAVNLSDEINNLRAKETNNALATAVMQGVEGQDRLRTIRVGMRVEFYQKKI